MISQVFECFVTVLGRCAAMLFRLPLSEGVTLGSFLTACAVLGVVIAVVFAGIRAFVGLYNDAYDERQKAKAQEARR